MLSFTSTTLCLPFLVLSTGLNAQINEIGTVPARLLSVHSLSMAGVKVYSTTQTSLTLYNLDMSSYATITYPPLPAGYSYFSVLYITESTFDTDPMTVELMMLTQSANGVSGTRVIRDDGTVLFEELGLSFSGTGGYSEMNAKPPLFADADGIAYMVLTNDPFGNNPPTQSRLYQLPGTIPCMDCTSGSGMGLQEIGMTTVEGELALFPNPTSGEVNVNYVFPVGTSKGHLMLTNALGHLVATVPLNASGHATLRLDGHANGHYGCSLVVEGRIIRTRQLELVR